MDAAVWGFVGVVVGAVITGLVNISAEVVRGRQSSLLDTQKRADDRRIQLDEIQRANLLALQDRLAEWMRAQGKMHHFDLMTLRARGTLTQMPEALSDEMFEADRRLQLLAERVKDDELRSMIVALRSLANTKSAAHAVFHEGLTEQQLERDLMEMMERANPVAERVGLVLRAYL